MSSATTEINDNDNNNNNVYGRRASRETMSTINFTKIRNSIGRSFSCKWAKPANALFCYIFEYIYYYIILWNIECFAKQYREFKNKMIHEDFSKLDYYEKRDALSNKLGLDILEPVLFTAGFEQCDKILENILTRLDEVDSMKELWQTSSCTKLRLTKLYECSFPIHAVGRDLRVIGYRYGFTIIHHQLSIILGMFMEFLILQFMESVKKQAEINHKNTKIIQIEDVQQCMASMFETFNIPYNEDIYAQCMYAIPSASETRVIDAINSFPIPPLKKR